MKFELPPGATPLDPDYTAGLIPDHIRNQQELNEWAFGAKHGEILDMDFLLNLHWRGAGGGSLLSPPPTSPVR